MPGIDLSLLAVAVLVISVIDCTSSTMLDRYGENVNVRYVQYFETEGRSTSVRYYQKTCSMTCNFRFIGCWAKRKVCTNRASTRYVTVYKIVSKQRPVYYCAPGWRQRGSDCSIAACFGCNKRGNCKQPWICTCHQGWRGSQCQSDLNECVRRETNKCNHRARCINTVGSFRCTCTAGYRLNDDLRTCNDVDECERNTHSCSANGFCHNTRGSYKCSCKKGYQLGSDQKTCQDVDECKTYQNDCDYKAGCQNTVGSFICTCQAGYYLAADGKTCKDVDECVNSDCQQNCVNYLGGYNCFCNTGYRRNSKNFMYCDDIDECFEKKDGCSQICTNKDGGFNCSCNKGYHLTWDEKHCIDIDECSSGKHGCDQDCKNTHGSYECLCREGFELSRDGRTCSGKQCLPIYTPMNGNKTCSGYTTEHTCVFTCSTGFKQSGSSIRRCTPSRRWTGKETKCEPIYCPDPPEPTNGFIYHPCNKLFSSECIAGCDDGFYINETSKMTCTVDGRWEPNKITCHTKKGCEPNPCRHGGECTDITSSEFSCDCSRTGYKGKRCETGFIDIPDYPTIFADGTATSVEYRVSPPDNDVFLRPQSVGVQFDPPDLLFKKKSTTLQSLKIIARRPGIYFVRYHLSGPGSAGFRVPQKNALIVETSEKSALEISEEDYMTFSSECYSVERHQCSRSQVRITARSTRPWRKMFGLLVGTNGIVSFSNGKFEIPYSITGDKFISRNPSSLNNNCGSSPAKKYSLAEMIKRRVLTKSFLNVVRDSLPKWLDVKLRRNLSSRSVVEDDLKVYFLSGKRVLEKLKITGQPMTDGTFYSLLISPDLDLIVDGDHVSLGLPDREASFSVALELCGTPPYNVVLKPSTNLVDVINKLSVFKKLRAYGWSLSIFSLQISNISNISKRERNLIMATKFSKDFRMSNSVNFRVDFDGTLNLNVHNLENMMDSLLDRKLLAVLDGRIALHMEFIVEGKMTKLSIKIARTISYATFGGRVEDACLLETKQSTQGLFMENTMEYNPFLHTELDRFVELDQPSNMSCFLSAILYHEKISKNSRYREASNGVKMTFHGNLKFGALRFDNLEVELRLENPSCQNSSQAIRSKIIAKLGGKYGQRFETAQKKLGIFKVNRGSKINLQIGRESAADSGGSFSGIANVLGFKSAVNVAISQSGLAFSTMGRINGLFDVSVTFKSSLVSWNDQRYTTTGVFEIKEASDNLDRLLEKEIKKYTAEYLTKLKKRIDISGETENRAQSRLREVQILREESRKKMNEINAQYGEISHRLIRAEENLNLLLEFIDSYGGEIQQLTEELNKLCEVKNCPKVCHQGIYCTQCWSYTFIEKNVTCSSTCHKSKQERMRPYEEQAICKNERCKRIHSQTNWAGVLVTALGVVTLNPVIVVAGVRLLEPGSEHGWHCYYSEVPCQKPIFNYDYIHTPYSCDDTCLQKVVNTTIREKCCSNLSCASFIANVSCFAENSLCKKARKEALKEITKVKADAAMIVGSLDSARQNLSFWNLRREKLSITILSAKRSLDSYEDAAQNLEKAYNITKENRKRIFGILARTLSRLRNSLSENGKSLIKILDITFETKVLPQQDTDVLLLNIKLQFNKKQHELSTLLNLKNLGRSLRNIAKEILEELVEENAQISRKKRSVNINDIFNDVYILQSFHRLCSEFSTFKQTLEEVARSLFERAEKLQMLRNEEVQRKSFSLNNSVIFENFNVNKEKLLEYNINVNYDSYIRALKNDPELLEAKNVQNEALKNEYGAVHSSSVLFYKNWLATMESMFAEYSGECSGFEDCLKYTFDSLLEISIGSSALNGNKLREQILNLERKFFNVTSKSNMSVNEAVHVSRDLLRDVKDMSGVEDVCAHAPNITQQPEPFTELGVNETLVLTCEAAGDFLVYQWRFNGEVLNNQHTNILRINNTSPSHSGNYSCDASNHIAKASSIVAVVVIATPPLIVLHPVRRLNVVLSGYSSLHCKVKKDAHNTSYHWWFRAPNSSSFASIPNERFSHLSFVPVKLHHEGWYFCNVSNSFGHTISKLSFVQVLKYSLPVPVAKLSLTVISKYSMNETSVYYRDTLANILKSRLAFENRNCMSTGELMKDLKLGECNIVPGYYDELERTEVCDWTFKVIGQNVTSKKDSKEITSSYEVEKIVNATYNLKNVLADSDIANNITFLKRNSNHSALANSLTIMEMSLICPKGQFFVEKVYKCAQCPPGFKGVLINGTATCAVCPRGFYQPKAGKTFCYKCPDGFATAEAGAIQKKKCKDENKYFMSLLLENDYHGDVLVTINASGLLENVYMKPTETVVKNKKWKFERFVTVSAVEAGTNRVLEIDGQSVIPLKPTMEKSAVLKVLNVKAPRYNTYLVKSDAHGYLHHYRSHRDDKDLLQFSKARAPAHFRFINHKVLQEVNTKKCIYVREDKLVVLEYNCNGSTTSRWSYNSSERHLKIAPISRDLCLGLWQNDGFPDESEVRPGLSHCDDENKISFEPDKDECFLDLDNCGNNSYCINTVGGFSCQCDVGFTGNGINCIDIDECSLLTHTCVPNANCTNTHGSYVCSCDAENESSCKERFIRLRGPSSSNGTGRVEVFYNGQWGTVCDDGWDINDARVACRQLGYRNALGAFHGGQVPSGLGEIWLDEVDCAGNEQNLSSCSHPNWEGHDCRHSEDAGVECTQEDVDYCSLGLDNCHWFSQCTTTDAGFSCRCNEGYTGNGVTCMGKNIRLKGLSISNGTGRVEVFHKGQWGTVCDDRWEINDARVACRQLGYPDALRALQGKDVPSGAGQIMLDEVGCTGSEQNLGSCFHRGWGISNCGHSEDAGVQCSLEDPRMMDSSHKKGTVSKIHSSLTPSHSSQAKARSDVLPERISSKSDHAQIEPLSGENYDDSRDASEGKGQ
ncbi:uncharacterized protein LOC114531439 [Dendronephthya gigantea]|uniref:uncharacterized protein LOC114531439 n=1 Tax=Dendronephthya gigantea TaxID=151771 RepID=UPI00106B8D52|nr:uncharacterized protein LOC114531439 [Dendronephthya gigantea]XP_028408847.1 uncharacterized protein LOC114531439 [Dendronephthya gigantea]